MYSVRGSLVLAFHGCDESVRDKIVSSNQSLLPSKNKYDWLGNGIYFWENNPKRALEYAKFLQKNPGRGKKPISKSSVIGAVINLGYCLDLVDSESIEILKTGYQILRDTSVVSEFKELKNKPAGVDNELLLRELDCAVIETVCEVQESQNLRQFDSVRGVFFEGKDIYPNAGFKEKNHIQICIRNPNCIKGYFMPRVENKNYLVP